MNVCCGIVVVWFLNNAHIVVVSASLYSTDQPLMSYCSLLKNGVSVCACVDYRTLALAVIFKIASTHTNTTQQHRVSTTPRSPSVNNVLMTIELAVRCPLFTGCHGSNEEARS